MFQNVSMTVVGLLVVILAQFIPIEEAQVVGEAIGILLAWYGRVRIGDISLLGVRK